MLSLFDGSECQNERALRFEFVILKSLEKLEKITRKRIFEKISSTKESPFHYFERLTGRDEYKLRVGDYRIIADIDEKTKKNLYSIH
jgi:mRNA-degrading endonuclease RelE of RelBE toxin-antitoxin system